jgi:hypothetical protein
MRAELTEHQGVLLYLAITVIALWGVFEWISLRQPYIESREVRLFFFYALPTLLFLSAMFLLTRRRVLEGKSRLVDIYEKAECKSVGGGRFAVLRIVAAIVVGSFLLGYADTKSFALPTRWLAKEKVVKEEVVSAVNIYGYHFQGRSRISLVGGTYFIWPSKDRVLMHITSGGCIRIKGRRWLLGVYVERIEACS